MSAFVGKSTLLIIKTVMLNLKIMRNKMEKQITTIIKFKVFILVIIM